MRAETKFDSIYVQRYSGVANLGTPATARRTSGEPNAQSGVPIAQQLDTNLPLPYITFDYLNKGLFYSEMAVHARVVGCGGGGEIAIVR